MVFPNTGFVIATISIGNSLKDETVLYVGNGLTIAVITMWFFVLFKHVQAVYVADIIYPGMDEDIADHQAPKYSDLGTFASRRANSAVNLFSRRFLFRSDSITRCTTTYTPHVSQKHHAPLYPMFYPLCSRHRFLPSPLRSRQQVSTLLPL